VIGLGAALVATRALAGMLYGVSLVDPLSLLSVAALVAAIALVACYLPARRALRVDPSLTLRSE
jgi:ABC-type antimicrobial peptide transport system permease subunit